MKTRSPTTGADSQGPTDVQLAKLVKREEDGTRRQVRPAIVNT
jgi:hypothetical protein